MILLLTGRGIYVSFDILFDSKAHSDLPSFSFGFATLEERILRLQDSETHVSHREAMWMLYLASPIVTSALRLSGRPAASRSRRVLNFYCAIFSSCLLLPSLFSTVDGR